MAAKLTRGICKEVLSLVKDKQQPVVYSWHHPAEQTWSLSTVSLKSRALKEEAGAEFRGRGSWSMFWHGADFAARLWQMERMNLRALSSVTAVQNLQRCCPTATEGTNTSLKAASSTTTVSYVVNEGSQGKVTIVTLLMLQFHMRKKKDNGKKSCPNFELIPHLRLLCNICSVLQHPLILNTFSSCCQEHRGNVKGLQLYVTCLWVF